MSLKGIKARKAASKGSSSSKITPKASTSAVSAPSALQRISQLEKKLVSSTSKSADLNPLVDLLETVNESKKVKTKVAALNALHNAFTVLIPQGKVIGKVRQQADDQADSTAEALLAVREWVKGRWNDYQLLLCNLLSSPEPALAVSSSHSLAFLSVCDFQAADR